MRIHGKAGAFAAAAKIAASAAGNGSIPILGAALIDAGDRITFSGTDLDLSLRAECAGTVVAAGRAAVPADALSGLLAGLAADAEVAVETVDAGVQVKAGRSRYRLEGLPASEFPPLPAMPASGELTLGRDRVRRLFGALAFTIPTEDTRYYLCGAYLHVADGHLTSVATDGYRLVRSNAYKLPNQKSAVQGNALARLRQCPWLRFRFSFSIQSASTSIAITSEVMQVIANRCMVSHIRH